MDVRFAAANLVARDDRQAADAILHRAGHEALEQRHLLGTRRDDELAAPIVPHIVSAAERVETLGALDTEDGFQRRRGEVQPRVDDTAVVCAGFHPRSGMPFENCDRTAGRRDFRGGGQPGDARSNNETID
jgi:hypothetical protein